ncbi:EscU/YscU/HrcU family type III secretion system export apparatus switch protein [Nitrosovibrio sp. Nv17]|uniref:EscU/YscU/HrcU family type III secretion system export apparatus switch protein n=1 Tax=Nitrosovibrio sp. Nv17 TaxID=1855339 RepID=UPI000908E6B1|nr:EscU/YscU/HrcU family type III secretion system export apparatus switch protein [Nitrosovibrio sp. Nv17]SFW14566.1 flagellar biosynthesis protein [Nitrosovibrio sp. Nv17]
MERPDPLEASEAAASREAAVALAYHAGSAAPRVVAKGRGLVAEAIVREARAHGIYVHESPELVALLMQVDLDQHIPPQLYRAVAELLAWLYRVEGRMATRTEISALPRRDG